MGRIFLLVAAALFLGADAMAQNLYQNTDGWYLQAGGGITSVEEADGPDEDIDFDEGWMLGLSVGHRFAGRADWFGWDLELEGFWSDQDAEDDDVIRDLNIAGVLVNALIDLRLAERFSLYGGGGIGTSWVDVGSAGDFDFDEDDGPFLTWQAKAGFRYRFAERTSLFAGYRFMNVDDVELDDEGIGDADFDLETQMHALEVGLRFGPAGT